MDFGNIGENVPAVVMIVGLIVVQFFLRRKHKVETKPQEITEGLLSEARLNLSLCEIFTFSHRTRKFTTTTWQINKNKLDFLNQSLQVTLSDAFTMAEDFNQQISAAKKYKSTSYLAIIDVDKLKDKLTKSQEGLEEWLQATVGTTEPSMKIPGVFDDLLGKN
ncbi:hypothetical protein ACFLTO_05135 [Chloroflexota bacterium]